MYFAVYITAKDLREARTISRVLLKEGLIACANIIPKIESLYWWKGRITNENEALIIGKTRSGLEDRIIACVKKYHSYEVPCVNFMPVSKGNPDFFKWIEEETSQK